MSTFLENTAITVIGNPGTGKSTILNTAIGSPVFSSGLSFGTGLTTHLQEHDYDGAKYIDTPGLDDINSRSIACEHLNLLLKSPDVSLKIVFVVIALKGRILPKDALTIRLVLDAISSVNVNDRFGVIVNQAPSEWISTLKSSPIHERRIKKSYTSEWSTSHWLYVPYEKRCDAITDILLSNGNLISKFLKNVPVTRPKGVKVRDIDISQFDKKLQNRKLHFDNIDTLFQQQLKTQSMRMHLLDRLLEQLQHNVQEQSSLEREAFTNRDEQLKALENEIEEQVYGLVSANCDDEEMNEDVTELIKKAQREEMETCEKMLLICEAYKMERLLWEDEDQKLLKQWEEARKQRKERIRKIMGDLSNVAKVAAQLLPVVLTFL